MDKQLFFRRKLVTAVAAAFALTGPALATEVEPNDFITTPQRLEVGADGSVSVNGVVGTIGGSGVMDVDFYAFDAQAGDKVTINIDGAAGGQRSFDSIIFLFGPGILGHVYNDDSTADAGSPEPNGVLDSRIDQFEVPQTGTYTVAVTGVPVFLNGDGSYPTSPVSGNGDYTLVISGITVAAPAPEPEPAPPPAEDPALQASIEIKTDKFVRGSRHEFVVALLGSSTFEPRDVDVSSLTFALAGATERSVKRCSRHLWRVNRDRKRDLVCHFRADLSGVSAGNVKAVLRGKTKGGQAFEGQTSVRVMEKRGHRRDRDRDDRRRGRDRDDD
jgi:hypothetical protein